MKLHLYIFFFSIIVTGCSDQEKEPNLRIVNNIKLTRNFLKHKNNIDFYSLIEDNKKYKDSSYKIFLDSVNSIREINEEYSIEIEKLDIQSDSFNFEFSLIQDKYKEEILKRLDKVQQKDLSRIRFENILTGAQITIYKSTRLEKIVAKEALLHEIEMFNYSLPLEVLRRSTDDIPHCQCCNK